LKLMGLTNRVKELRAKHRFTQNDLAERVDVTRQTIVALEKGSYIPSLLLAMKIAQVFQLPIEEIFFMEDEGK
jgi:putative transcriptional regulator